MVGPNQRNADPEIKAPAVKQGLNNLKQRPIPQEEDLSKVPHSYQYNQSLPQQSNIVSRLQSPKHSVRASVARTAGQRAHPQLDSPGDAFTTSEPVQGFRVNQIQTLECANQLDEF